MNNLIHKFCLQSVMFLLFFLFNHSIVLNANEYGNFSNKHITFEYRNIASRGEVQPNEIDRFIDDAPVDFGYQFNKTRIVVISDLINAAIEIYRREGTRLGIYNSNVNYHPTTSDYIMLINNGDKYGFMIIKPKGEVFVRESIPYFSLTCRVEVDDLIGSICYDPIVLLNGKKQDLDYAVKNFAIFQLAISNSERSTWETAN